MTKRQNEEVAKYCMGVSQLSLGSLVLSAFSPETPLILRLIVTMGGLTIAAAFFIMGLRLFKKV